MYYAHFGLTRPPFRITPDTSLFFSGAERGSVLEALTYVVMTGEGITKVIGEVGSGKTMLCRMLEEKLPDNVETIYIANPNIDADNILNVIAFEAGLEQQTTTKLELMQTLHNWLLECHAMGRRVVVLIEEAQGMPIETLEEIRLLSNLETGEDKLLQIVLFGQPELDEKLSRVEIRQLQDRIANNFYLSPLTREQIRDYANFRMRQAGYHGPDIFDGKVCGVLVGSSKGLIRRINILADKTLLAAFSEGTTRLTRRHARIAAKDSHFTDTHGGFNRIWWFAAAGVTGGFIIALILAWFIWPDKPAIATGAEQAAAVVSPTQPRMTVNRQRPATAASESRRVAGNGDSLRAEAGKGVTMTQPIDGVTGSIRPSEPSDQASLDTSTGGSETDTGYNEDRFDMETAVQPEPADPDVDQVQIDLDAAVVLAQSLLENRIAVTREWLAESSPDLYSIQLMTLKANSAHNLDKYLKGLPNTINLNDIFIYETNISGDPMLGVLYQQFESRDEALRRMNNMPATFRNIEPFLLRSVRGLRNEIADSNG